VVRENHEDTKNTKMHEGFEPLPRKTEDAARDIVDAAVAVHRVLGPGLLESAYEACLAHELEKRGRSVLRQVALPIVYDTIKLEAGYRIDLIIDGDIIVEVKSIEALAPIHDAQLLTYLRLSGRRLGFLINFNVALLKEGIKRRIL
jgi:GxxExxY protein